MYGVLNMLRRLESDYKADYKASSSIPRARPSATTGIPNTRRTARRCRTTWSARSSPSMPHRAAGWLVMMIDGVEADDVIGTWPRGAAAADIDTI